MSLKWHKNEPDTQDLCTIVETETTWNFDTFYLEGKTDTEVAIYYNVIIGGDSYITKVEIEDRKYFVNKNSDDIDLFDFISNVIDRFYSEESSKDDRDGFANTIYTVIENFCNENNIILP